MHTTARAVFGLSLLFAAGPAFAEQDQARAKAESLTSILERIRQDVGFYEVQAAHWRSGIQPDTVPVVPACAISDFDFDVTNVQASLQTVIAETGTSGVELQVTFLGEEGSVGAGVHGQASRTETIALTRRFRYDKEQLARYEESEDYQLLAAAHEHARLGATQANAVWPIADTLIELRKSLIRSAEKLPCFEWADKDVKPESSSITLEFLVQQAADGKVGFNFWIVSAKADATIESTNVNTLVVSYAPHTLAAPDPQPATQQLGQAPGPPNVMIR